MSARARRVIARPAVALAVAATGCVIPDANVRVEDEYVNAGAVRIVEPTPITPRANQDCDERTTLRACPNVPYTVSSGLMRPDQPLCVCTGRNLVGGGFELYVEDPDVDEAGNPTDDILGALLLDMPPNAEDPRDYLAYTNLLPPEEPARRYRASDVTTLERPDPHLRVWPISTQSNLDLCNDNDGAKLQPALHELRLVVTDRPWYRPPVLDDEGTPVLDENGQPLFHDPVIGMPDLPAGATYDTTTYVFQCHDGNDPPEGIECNCED